MKTLETQLDQLLNENGFDHFGYAPLTQPLSLSVYRDWISEKRHGEMTYLQEHLSRKANSKSWLPQANSAIVIGLSYRPHPAPRTEIKPFHSLKIAKYAQGDDYHLFFKHRLLQLVQKLEQHFPNASFSAHTDSSPFMERDLGYQAQLGWFGKNSCLIHPQKGSFFLIGEIITSLSLNSQNKAVPDFCGTCQRCITACPTQAIRTDRTLEASRCISYLNIELKGFPSAEQSKMIGEWFFGCDICQDVCPWNQKVFGTPQNINAGREQQIEDLRFILNTSGKKLERAFQYTPLLRRHSFGLKRNALVLIANLKLSELKSDVIKLAERESRYAEFATWVAEQL